MKKAVEPKRLSKDAVEAMVYRLELQRVVERLEDMVIEFKEYMGIMNNPFDKPYAVSYEMMNYTVENVETRCARQPHFPPRMTIRQIKSLLEARRHDPKYRPEYAFYVEDGTGNYKEVPEVQVLEKTLPSEIKRVTDIEHYTERLKKNPAIEKIWDKWMEKELAIRKARYIKKIKKNRDRGRPHGRRPPTPPDVRVRIRRFESI